MRPRFFILAFAACLALTGCGKKEEAADTQILNVGIATWPGHGPGFVAQEKGFFGNLKVNIIAIDDWAAKQNAFISGKNQLDCTTVDTLAMETAQRVPSKILFMLDQSYGSDGIVARKEIRSMADLKGKRVAYTRCSPSHFLLGQCLKKADLTM